MLYLNRGRRELEPLEESRPDESLFDLASLLLLSLNFLRLAGAADEKPEFLPLCLPIPGASLILTLYCELLFIKYDGS